MKIDDYGYGLYILLDEPVVAEMKIYDGWDHVGWEKTIIEKVFLRRTDRAGYYIVKLADGDRVDRINDFRVGGKSLKSYLEKINITQKGDQK